MGALKPLRYSRAWRDKVRHGKSRYGRVGLGRVVEFRLGRVVPSVGVVTCSGAHSAIKIFVRSLMMKMSDAEVQAEIQVRKKLFAEIDGLHEWPDELVREHFREAGLEMVEAGMDVPRVVEVLDTLYCAVASRMFPRPPRPPNNKRR